MKGKVFFNPIDGSAPLSISWASGPKGDAVEAKSGDGVGFFSHAGELLGVIFDDVKEVSDKQSLVFKNVSVQLSVIKGKVSYRVENKPDSKSKRAS